MTVTFTDTEREQVLLTLAFLALDRPSFTAALRGLAGKFEGHDAFDRYCRQLDDVGVAPAAPTRAQRSRASPRLTPWRTTGRGLTGSQGRGEHA